MAGPARSPLPHCPPPPPRHPLGGAGEIILPTRVSLRKVRTARVALSSPNTLLTEGRRGLFHSHNLSILFHITRARRAQARHLATKWNLD